jgi:hypothetical protein
MVLNICNVREIRVVKIRNPNPEFRKKSELRKPNSEGADARFACNGKLAIEGAERLYYPAKWPRKDLSLPAKDARNVVGYPLAPAATETEESSRTFAFGFRPSDFFRISDFGLRILNTFFRISGFGLRISRRFSFLLATIPSGLHDIQDPVPIPDPWRWVWIGALIAALFALALYAWLRPRKPAPAPYVRVIPPHEKARKALLDALELIDEPREFCILVSDALRVYLDERFTLGAPEKTTEEFLTELQVSSVLSEEQKDILEDFLNRCDLVKFARYEPREPELRALYDSALRLISETEPREIILPAATVSAPNQ